MLAPAAARAQAQGASPLMGLLRAELDRNFAVLKEKADPPAYFLAYLAVEEQNEGFSATLGAVANAGRTHRRVLDCAIRVGSPSFDNLVAVGGDRARFTASTPLPVEDDELAIRRLAWQQADRAWRSAAQRYIQVRARSQMKPGADALPMFSTEQPVRAAEAAPKHVLSQAEWVPRLRRLSLRFAENPGVITSSVTLNYRHEVRTYVNSEGTELQHGRGMARLTIVARGKATDGQDLLTTESFEAEDPAKLPDEKRLAAAVDRVIGQLAGQLTVQPVDPYVGPAILSGSAAGVFFHEIFGHRIEGHRQRDEREGQTFANSIGEKVLPEFITVLSDPTVRSLGGTDLHGWYKFDDEGVPARPVVVVDQGVLRNFLMSRMPLPGFPNSNGHGRKQPGLEATPRQSNLIVRSDKRVSDAQLRALLIEEVRRQNKPYGLYFERVTGGFTTTQREGLQAFTVIPLVVYQVFPDGKPDRLVRGVDIVGTPLASFAKIIATGDRDEVFNGFCGAESGSVPVSAVSPALLVSEIEVQRKPNPGDRPPLLRRPQVTEAEPR
jgi:predicted Zn-dependent protease